MGATSNTNLGPAVNPHRAFLDVIRAEPAEDGPRLVYADWLSEHGDPRGEFIVVQCTRARLRREGRRATAEYRRAHRREKELLATPALRLSRLATRGFVGQTFVPAATLRAQWPTYRELPLEAVTFPNDPLATLELRDLGWLLRQPEARHVLTIGVQTPTGGLELDASALEELSEDDDAPVWPDDALPDPRLRSAIRRLHFHNGEKLVARLAEAAPPNLVELSFAGADRASAARVAAELPTLVKLSVWLEEATALAFLDTLRPGALRDLAIQCRPRTSLGAEGVRRLAASDALPGLTNLIADVPLDEAFVAALSTRATALAVLSPGAGVSGAGLAALAASELPRRLRWLSLVNDGTVPSLLPFAEAPFARLESLTLEDFRIDDDVARALAANAGLAGLVDFKLTSCVLRPQAAEILARSPHLDAVLEPKFTHCRLYHETTQILAARWPDAVFLQDR